MRNKPIYDLNPEELIKELGPVGPLEFVIGEPRMDGTWTFDGDPDGLAFDYERTVLIAYVDDPGPPPVVPRPIKQKWEYDLNGDGVTDRWMIVTRDYLGNIIVRVIYYDDNFDGLIDRCEVCTYWQDERGITRSRCETRLIRYVDGTPEVYGWDIDEDGDGNTDSTIRIKDIYDETGFRVKRRFEYDDDNDGEIDRTKTIIYNLFGQIERIEFDDDADGEPDRFWPEREM